MAITKRIALVSNGGSGKGTSREGSSRTTGELLSPPHRTLAPKTFTELDAAIRSVHADRYEIIAIAGGDGTLHQVLTRVLWTYGTHGTVLPELLILPTGTMNFVATYIGATRYAAPALLKRVMRKIDQGEELETFRLDTLMVNNDYGFIYGSGLPVNILKKYYAPDTERGPKGMAKIAADSAKAEIMRTIGLSEKDSGLADPQPVDVSYRDDDGSYHGFGCNSTGLIAATIERFSFGCRLFPGIAEKPGHFMLRSTLLSYWELFSCLPQLWSGSSLRGIEDITVRKASVEYERSTTITIDGDLKDGRLIDRLQCGPAVSFIKG